MPLHQNFIVSTKIRSSRQIFWLMFALVLFSSFAVTFCVAAPLTIASQGKSTFAIVVPQLAPVSVNDAAAEMQRDIAEATGAKLPIIKDDKKVESPFISLGSTEQAKQAGISAESIDYDGFRIVTKEQNLYIIGIDTTAEKLTQGGEALNAKVTLHPEIPGSAFTKDGGFSTGTANGVYTFLEDRLGVRWLFQGELGRDIPQKSTFTVESVDHTEVPLFNIRLGNGGSIEFQNLHKQGFSVRHDVTHNFDTVPVSMYDTHPEWFPMFNGVRPRPPQRGHKLETTNQEMVRFFAERAIAALKERPELNSYSLSPSDGWGFSESPESKALYDPPAPGESTPSVTPLVLKFYRDVAAIVAKEYPQGRLSGYLYTIYSMPPTKGGMDLPENFTPVIVGKSMGYSFYRPETRKLEAELLEAWSKPARGNWYYYGMPTWLRENSGQMTPAAPEQLNFLYHTLVKNGIKGAYMYGTFKGGALVNYLHAKMLWNPTGDAVAIQRDWLTRAYGPQAGAVMEQLYNKMDESWFADYFRSPESRHYNVSETMFRIAYAKHYPEMEKLFLEAWNQPMTETQKQRLELIKYNMITLQWRLRNAGYLPADYQSPLKYNSQQVFDLFTNKKTSDNFSYIIVRDNPVKKTDVQWNDGPALPQVKAGDIPNSEYILLYPTQDGEITLKPSPVSPGSSFLVYYVQDGAGKSITRGFLTNNEDINFKVKANQPYYFNTSSAGVTLRPEISWKISVPGAARASTNYQNEVLSLQASGENKSALVYVYVPQSLNLEVGQDADTGDLTIQTPSSAKASVDAEKTAQKEAAEALKAGLKKHQASMVQDLNEKWKFVTDPQKMGEKNGYYETDFDGSSWKTIKTIGSWQSNGFPGYNGTAWYRKSIDVHTDVLDPLAAGNKQLLLFFGAIDGDAEIYLNGVKIGTHTMAEYGKGWEVSVTLNVSSLLQEKNVIAVKVTKDKFASGIYRGVSLLSGVE